MKIATIIARVLLGLVFAVFGSNKFLRFLPNPPMQGAGAQFMGAMFETHYICVVASCEVIGGLLLLTGRFVPLGLTLVGPVVVNILAFHTFMDPAGLPIALVVSTLALFLLWRYRENFAGLVQGTPARVNSSAQQTAAQTTTVN
ncbi:MAG: DoxX family protein [Verrucomicrobiota bacterium]|nr:DoxX family protein [Verrucomicrobiota bacterium]